MCTNKRLTHYALERRLLHVKEGAPDGVEVVRAGLFEDDAPEYRADDVGADEDTRHTQDRDQLGLS